MLDQVATGKAASFEYIRPKMYKKQKAFVDCKARYVVVEACPKSGKTMGMGCYLFEKALSGEPGDNYWWVAPTLGVSDIAFRRFKTALMYGGMPKNRYKVRESIKSIDFYVNENGYTRIWFKGADKPDTLYGDDVHAVVIDEATRCKETAWTAVRSTLTATGGQARIIGNVRGRKNWAYKLARRAQAGEDNMEYFGLTAADAITGGIYTQDEIDDARKTIPDEAAFMELYYLVPSDDAGNPFGFKFIEECCVPFLAPGPARSCGVDLAKKVDWTVIAGFNQDDQMCMLERFRTDWENTRIRVEAGIKKARTAIDSTGVGDVIVEDLQRKISSKRIQGYIYTSGSKQILMESLAYAMQQHQIQIYEGDNKWLRNEFDSFEYQYTRNGVKYAPIEGMTDDGVNGTALANWIRRNRIETIVEFGKPLPVKSTVERFTRTDRFSEESERPGLMEQMENY